MGKNVAVFVDVANIFYAAKAAGVDIDYVTLLKSAIAGRDFVRAYAYTGLDPDNENQRNFHSFLARHGYKVVSKDIRKYGDGKVKANLDIELVVDMIKTARNLDVAIVVSGDGDFAPAIRAVQEMGVRVEVISFRGNTASDLIDVADLFTDIIQIAKVEKGSSRSGRRVADDDEDLSMTEVPDKLTEGTGRGRGRGTGRGRDPDRRRRAGGRRQPVALALDHEPTNGTRGGAGRRRGADGRSGRPAGREAVEGRRRPVSRPASPARRARPLSRTRTRPPRPTARRATAPATSTARVRAGDVDAADGVAAADVATRASPRARCPCRTCPTRRPRTSTSPRRRPRARRAVPGRAPSAPSGTPRSGQTRTPSVESTPFDVDEEDEPAIPEYLIAEQRRGRSAGRGGRPGARGGRSGYSAAVDRERYGRGGGGGINRYPDVSGRSGGGGGGGGRSGREPRRDGPCLERPATRSDRPAAGRSDEPWSEVPPEVEAMLRAQLARRTDERPAPATAAAVASDAVTDEPASARGSGAKGAPRSTTRRRTPAATTTDGGG